MIADPLSTSYTWSSLPISQFTYCTVYNQPYSNSISILRVKENYLFYTFIEQLVTGTFYDNLESLLRTYSYFQYPQKSIKEPTQQTTSHCNLHMEQFFLPLQAIHLAKWSITKMGYSTLSTISTIFANSSTQFCTHYLIKYL